MEKPMKGKKDTKGKPAKSGLEAAQEGASSADTFGVVTTKADLKAFLLNIRDKMAEEIAAPIYALSAINYVMNLPEIYAWLDNENKEIARDIWLRLKQSGLQLRNPPMLFSPEENGSLVVG